jgi:N-acetyl sugar amidotransferase
MKYCKLCLTTDLRPNASFSADGICIACEYSVKNSSQDDSHLKLAILQKKIKDARSKLRKKGAYDCIVGVSGGKDSTRQAHWVRDRLGLSPLLVCCGYPPLQMSHVGADNLSNLISMGFDLIVATPAPKTSAELSLISFKKFGNVCKTTEIALFSTVPRIAIDLGINLIFWGENPALQVGDAASEGIDEFDGNNLRKLNTLTSGGVDWIKKAVHKPYLSDHYIYPHEVDFEKKKISIFYLGPAWDDWGNQNNSIYAALQGLTLRPGDEAKTGDISNASMLDEEFTNINMMIKYFKFGFGRTTDLVCENIRNGTMTREEGISIVEVYDGVCDDEIIESYCKYVNISVGNFWEITNRWVNSNLFHINQCSRPQKKFRVGYDYVY